MEQHRSECSLEPVACEMKEFGCSVVVPRKELARHMRESELQHLTAMTMLNLRLTRQLQQESTERDRKIERLMSEITDMQEMQDEQLTELKADVKKIKHATGHILEHEGRFCSVCDAFTFTQYSYRKCSGQSVYGDPLYSHHHGYMFRLKITYGCHSNAISVYLSLMNGEYDDQLHWPVKVRVQLELLNQAGDHHHVVRTKNMKWTKGKRDSEEIIDVLMEYPDLEKVSDGVRYMTNNCLKFRVRIQKGWSVPSV